MSEEKNLRKLTILVVEDNQDFLDLAVEMLNSHHCLTAKTSKEAIEKYKSNIPDIVFLDITLPDGNGHDVCKKIKHINSSAFVIMLTQSRLEEDVVKSMENGIAGYIVKPFSRKNIKTCMDKYFNQSFT